MLVSPLSTGAAFKAGAAAKRIASNVGDAAGDGVASNQAGWVSDERSLALVEQNATHTAVERIGCVHSDDRQAATVWPKPPNA